MRCQGEPTYIEPLTFLVDTLGLLLALAMNPWVGPGILRVGGGGGSSEREVPRTFKTGKRNKPGGWFFLWCDGI